MYFGWGGEDDDIHARARLKFPNVTRPSEKIGRYTMLKHQQEKASKKRLELLKSFKERSGRDGINSLRYKIVGRTYGKWFTRILVSIKSTEPQTVAP